MLSHGMAKTALLRVNLKNIKSTAARIGRHAARGAASIGEHAAESAGAVAGFGLEAAHSVGKRMAHAADSLKAPAAAATLGMGGLSAAVGRKFLHDKSSLGGQS